MSDANSDFAQFLRKILVDWSMDSASDQVSRLCRHYEAMVAANRQFNLTRITKPEEAAVKHYADSLALLLWAGGRGNRIEHVLDIGTGAGFPAFPLAVMRPDWSVTAIDATRKKIDFLDHVAKSLGVNNLECVHAHSSHWDTAGRDFSLFTCRALAPLVKSVHFVDEHASAGAFLVIFQTESAAADARSVVTKCTEAVEFVQQFDYQLPFAGEVLRRALVVLRFR